VLNIIDEYTRECLATFVARSIKAEDVLDQLFNLFVFRGVPEHIRSDNGPDFTAKTVRKWLNQMEVKPLFIEPGSPWENGLLNPLTAR
jgi:putative transposase